MKLALSLTARLTLLFVLLSSSVLIGLGWLLNAAVERHFIEMDRSLLEGKVEVLERLLASPPDAQELQALDEAVLDMFRSDPKLKVFVRTDGGSTILAPPDLSFPDQAINRKQVEQADVLFAWSEGDSRYRGLATTMQTALSDLTPFLVVVAINIDHHERFMERYGRTLSVFIPVAAFLSGLLGWWASRRGLSPLRLLQQRAASVTASQLDCRLPEESVPRELRGLAHELNCMLVRLEEAFRRLSNFSSDLAHEMRTPVSNLLTQTQVALSRSRTQHEYQETLASSAEELDRLSRMIADMLFLAQADNGLSLPSIQEIRLHDEIADLLEFYDALAEEEGVRLQASGQASVRGNRLMLRRAFSNLLSNAIRHAGEGGEVRITIAEQSKTVSLIVENTGDPIPPSELPMIFDRFYRAEAARPRHGSTTGGLGLGLAITRAIIHAHDGEIAADSLGRRTRFHVTLPRSAAASAP
ncbi:heavy metal sensor histidine kinase [Guyparkeria halophila]|uniref:Sensor protein n=1 Tax=Guyparkeria halophila TaxID=47960 RepID=A0A6I6D456_9GAMM|nr:heavy metal sensor histidine kinase [Guyparkeria halophila]QGT78925.1 heavy metal sensor histidine kinase [Guyparkeria halophila]